MRKKENKTEDQEPKKRARKKKSGTAEDTKPKRSRKKKEEKSEDQSKCAERMHREFLAEKAKIIGPVKKTKLKKSEPVKYENGEYLKTPTNLSSLKKYVTTYFRAIGWTSQDKQLLDTRLRVRNLKIKKNKEDKSVDISFKAVYLGKNEMMSKMMSKSYTLENSSEVRKDIIRLLSQAKHNKYFQEENAKHKKELEKMGWSTIY